MPPDAVRLVECGAVFAVRPDSCELPEALRRESIRRLASVRLAGDRRGFAWCRIRSDGRILLIVAGDRVTPSTLRHEMLLAAQLVAGETATADALDAVLEDGRRLRAAAKAASVREPDAEDVFMDIARIAGVWDGVSHWTPAFAEVSAMPFASVSEATLRMARSLGMPDASAATAVMHALVADLLGLLPLPSSASARQLVAGRFLNCGSPVSGRLFAAAVEAFDAACVPGAGR